MKFRKVLILLTVCVLAAVNLRASETSPVDSLMRELKIARSQNDSLPILYDLLDTVLPRKRKDIMLMIQRIAERNKDYDAQLDMFRNMAVYGAGFHDPELIEDAMDKIEIIPESEDKRQTKIFLRAMRATADEFTTEEERDNYTRQLMKSVADMPDNISPHERVSRLFALVSVLYPQSRGELLSQYLDALDEALKTLPQLPNRYLRSQFNNFAAVAYRHNDEYVKSIRADRNQLINNNQLQQIYQEKGRKFRNYDVSRYLRLARMLQNQEIITDKEFNETVDTINALIARNKEIAEYYHAFPIAKVGILMRQERYAEAIPLIKLLSDSAQHIYERRFYTRMLIDAAEKAGDLETKRNAEVRNSSVLEEFMKFKTSQRIHELQLLYDVNALRRQQISERFANERQTNTWLTLGIYGLLFVVALLIALQVRENRLRHRAAYNKTALEETIEAQRQKIERLTTKLAESNRRESEKTQMMTYISHELSTPLSSIINYARMIADEVPDKEVSDYISHFVEIIESNTRTIQAVTADMQEFALNESKPIVANNIPANPNQIATIAAETIEPQLDSRIKISVSPAAGDPSITTDPRRVQLLLLSCIYNMVKSINSGKITVRVVVSPEECQFIVAAPGATPADEPACIPHYASTLSSVNGEITYNAEVPAMTLTLKR